MFDDLDFELNPIALVTGGIGLLIGIVLMKYGGLEGLGLLGKLGMIIGSTAGGVIIGLIMFRD